MSTLFRSLGASGGTPKFPFAVPSASAHYMGVQQPYGTDYQVTTAKKFKCTRMIIEANASETQISVGYSDVAVPDDTVLPGGANEVYVFGIPTQAGLRTANNATIGTGSWDVYFEIPAQKYPFIFTYGQACCVILLGIEE